jgi:GNAT superfamily N-acetyltransferase
VTGGNLSFRAPVAADAAECFDIERSAYEVEEAASLQKIAKRIADYPQGFLLLIVDGKIAGFINSGCAHQVAMSDEEFKQLIGHDPGAPNVVIMSVVVAPEFQGLGYSKRLMQEFINRMSELGKKTVHLMCKEHFVPFYEKLGFHYSGLSNSQHGGMRWHEMMMGLPQEAGK